ncbi:MAG: nucleotide pyrophosphatase/phosphodiesterase family protein [Planctomycetota bacterium]
MKPLVIICCVGLTPEHLGSDTPNLTRLASSGFSAPMDTAIPAVTTTAQTTMLTGMLPQSHGIVGNGWYFRELGEVWFWRQSERLVQAPLPWSSAGGPRTLKHFWWYAMNSGVAATVTPRPIYHHDGRKGPDFYAHPYDLKATLRAQHGEFPLFNFWGPTASIRSTRWIADSFQTAFVATRPELALCYLPHLDYDLQRFGPSGKHLSKNLRQLDTEAGKVIAFAQQHGAEVLVVSEYGIEAVDLPVFPNRTLRQEGLLSAVDNAAGELLDPGASRAFAVVDHQLAHVYCADEAAVGRAATVLARLPGIERVYAGSQRREIGLDHSRSGDLVLLAARGAWFSYDYWLDDARRPDFARCVEIHKKPGYDPRELLFDPHGGKWRAMRGLARKMLGFRYLMDPISLDATLVKGSHGRRASSAAQGAIIIGSDKRWMRNSWHQTDVAGVIASVR